MSPSKLPKSLNLTEAGRPAGVPFEGALDSLERRHFLMLIRALRRPLAHSGSGSFGPCIIADINTTIRPA